MEDSTTGVNLLRTTHPSTTFNSMIIASRRRRRQVWRVRSINTSGLCYKYYLSSAFIRLAKASQLACTDDMFCANADCACNRTQMHQIEGKTVIVLVIAKTMLNVYAAVIVAVHCHGESSPGSSDECSTQRQVAANLWTKPISLSQ